MPRWPATPCGQARTPSTTPPGCTTRRWRGWWPTPEPRSSSPTAGPLRGSHSRGRTTTTWSPTSRTYLLDRAGRAVAAGVGKDRIVIDPGHDLNKNTLHSLELTRRLGELATLGFPLLASVSNKDFVQETLDLPRGEVTEGTLAAVVLCVLAGARIVRVHDVRAVRRALSVTEAVLGWRASRGAAAQRVTGPSAGRAGDERHVREPADGRSRDIHGDMSPARKGSS